MDDDPIVSIVDPNLQDQARIRDVVSSLGLQAHGYESAGAFLENDAANRSGCVVSEFALPNIDGIGLQEVLQVRGAALPVIFYAKEPGLSCVVRAMRNGAVHVLDKSAATPELSQAIRRALELNVTWQEAARELDDCQRRYATLSEQEHRVADLLCEGCSNKAMAEILGVGLRTIESRRMNVFRKMGTRSLAILIQKFLQLPSGRLPSIQSAIKRAERGMSVV